MPKGMSTVERIAVLFVLALFLMIFATVAGIIGHHLSVIP